MDKKLQDILEELYEVGRTDEEYNPLDRENTISGGKDKIIAQAKSKILEMFGEMVGEDRKITEELSKDLIEEAHLTGFSKVFERLYNLAKQEIRNRVKENVK